MIIEGLTLDWPAHERWSKEELLRQYATRPVHVAADTAADRQRINAGLGGHSESVTLAAYLDMMTAEQESCLWSAVKCSLAFSPTGMALRSVRASTVSAPPAILPA